MGCGLKGGGGLSSRLVVGAVLLAAGAGSRLVGASLERLLELRIDDLPLYSQDSDAQPPAAPVARLRQDIAAADGVLFVTPEYNRSIPGLLKNAIDQASRPWGQSKWGGKPAAVCGVSIGTVGTAVAQSHLHSVLSFLAMPQLGQPEMYIQWKDGLVVDGAIGQASREHVQKFVDALVAWMRQHQA